MTRFLQTLNRASLLAIAARSTAASSPATPAFTIFTVNPIFSKLNPKPIGSHSTTRLLSSPPTRFLLSYEYIPDVLEKRGPYREGHLGLAKDMIEKGTCVSGGPTMSPGEDIPNGGMHYAVSREVLVHKKNSLIPNISNHCSFFALNSTIFYIYSGIIMNTAKCLTLKTIFAIGWAALFVFTTKDAAEKFVAEDPYVSGGIVTGHSIDEWSVVVGSNWFNYPFLLTITGERVLIRSHKISTIVYYNMQLLHAKEIGLEIFDNWLKKWGKFYA